MKASTERILTTHVGSLPRSPAVEDCLVRKERGEAFDGAEFARILPTVLKLKARAILFEAANPRHEHEWTVWRDARVPEDLLLVPGVLDSCSNYVEHPELVAQRIERFAQIVGRERALAEGAALASKRLWP